MYVGVLGTIEPSHLHKEHVTQIAFKCEQRKINLGFLIISNKLSFLPSNILLIS